MNFEISTTVLMASFGAIILFTAALIFFLKGQISKSSERHYSDNMPARKTTDIFRWRNSFLNYGLLAALTFMVLAFSWTKYGAEANDGTSFATELEEIEVVPRTNFEPPKPTPPPAITEIPDDISLEEPVTFESNDLEINDPVEAPPVISKPAPVAFTPSKPVEEVTDEIFVVVEDKPVFEGCEGIENKGERDKCTSDKLLKFIYDKIKYPQMAIVNGIEGMVVVRFVVEKDGSVTGAEILREIGGGCGQEALRVVNLMPLWTPGKQRGRPVRVQYNLPVKFKMGG